MTERINSLLHTLRSRIYRSDRSAEIIDATDELIGLDPLTRDAKYLAAILRSEKPVLIEGDRMGFFRYNSFFPAANDGYVPRENSWLSGNLTPDYETIISRGFDPILDDINNKLITCPEPRRNFYLAARIAIEAVLDICGRYSMYAEEKGNTELSRALKKIPRRGAESFYEACVFLKLMIYTLRCNRSPHLTLGRFDKYMNSYFMHDLSEGISENELFETLEEFFISINFDTDLYQGVQQGDNGQSLVLGGKDPDGKYLFSRLSELCIRASLELNLIDPKINLRVCKETPFDIYLLGTQLTKKGLGFPQYLNDDVVIPGLIKLGYSPEDAYNYVVAACWEFIVPGCGMDIPNIVTFNFPKVINEAIHEKLAGCADFEAFLNICNGYIADECERLIKEGNRRSLQPSPYLSVFVRGCIENGLDLSENGAKYNNSGCHGAGISNAADSLAAIKKLVFDDRTIDPDLLIKALDSNFEGYPDIRNMLLSCPKMGNNDDYVDGIACALMKAFSENMNGKKNNRGGIYRAGTGSAMEYIWSARKVGATADGRMAYEPFGSSFSPSLTARLNGPLSLIQSFTKYDMTEIINGGPVTMEIHDTTFRNDMGIEKVALLVNIFIGLGGHELQLNAINRDRLIDTQKHPENYPGLIVRVWGWSGYFNELDIDYQNHIIRRTEFAV